MTKKSKFMSWLGFGKSDKKEAEQKAAADKQQVLAQEEAQKLEQEKLAQQEAEADRLKAEAETERLEQERIAAEKIEATRLEQEKLAQEQAEAERLKAEAETERLEQERQRAENAEKIAIEQANAELLAKQQADAEAQRQEHAHRLADQEKEMRLEQERLAAEKVEAERLEQIRLEKQDEAIKAEKLAIEQANAELLAKEQADAEAQRQEQAKRLAEQEAQMLLEQERIAAEKAENERLEQVRIAAEKAENERLEQERLEQERLAAEKAENERLEQERIAAEKAENEHLEQERLAAEQAENERLEQERLAAEKAENERLEQERLAAEKAENERLEQERIAAEEAENERLEQERITAELAIEEAKKAEKPKKEGFFSRLKKGLLKTRVNIGSGFASIFSGKKIDDELFEDLETQLLTADLGVDTTMKLIDRLTDAANRKQLKDGDALYELMKQEMAAMLKTAEQPLVISEDKKPFVILMVGVNGVGKTTTIGKMAKQFQNEGKSVMLAAGDTFRAAAVEQLQVWGERNSIPVIAQHTGADSASVVFDAFQAAKARNIDVLIADTAGRLQNKDNLMQELEKIARVMKKIDPDAPHEVMLTIDAGTGQNAISQVNLFNQCVGLTGITLSKLDGTAKGGVIFAVADKFNIPIRYIGVGEGIDDLRAFKSDDFIDALFSQDEDDV
ncbi:MULTISPECIES: signal recognition particle-docking protein FtsY [unclassified Pseudoalteromonas]|uniref:signal recognition particle-docking protein FtsY n=1 Tax=unclassified Pseudoalteromonas TaxID=194690 RepID=UPI001604090B|nr:MULTISPECIES: signal recognition particle-docking protein FtsY [unclassified Pseudoalteromonas]MBB1348909.1 signal recognition particle-docking protein FtsY [Pseudoalteromonas sp. SG45-3]MBB1356978.1 signal recognition particle-docking protein FtsY [Pseudoalteromonas sp. SG45-6]